jgi:hypothetical protein
MNSTFPPHAPRSRFPSPAAEDSAGPTDPAADPGFAGIPLELLLLLLLPTLPLRTTPPFAAGFVVSYEDKRQK